MQKPALAAVLVFLSLGCNSVVQKPTASFKAANLKAATEQGFRVDFDVNVDNPNGFAIPLSAAKYRIGFSGINVLDESAKPTGSIPAKGALPVTIPVTLSFEKLMAAEKAIVASGGNVPYDFDGELEFTAGPLAALGQAIRVPVKFSGTLALRDAVNDPVALLKSPAGRKIVEMLLGKNKLLDLFGK